MPNHLYGRIAMARRIDLVKAMGQHTHCLKTIRQGIAMSTDVYAVCQSADYQHAREQSFEVADEVLYQILTIGGTMARTDNINDSLLVEVGSTFIIEYDGGVVALTETLRIVGIIHTQCTDATFLHELHLDSSTSKGIVPVLHRLAQPRRDIRHNVTDVHTMVIDCLASTQFAVEQQACLKVKAHHACQRQGIVYLFFLHGL